MWVSTLVVALGLAGTAHGPSLQHITSHTVIICKPPCPHARDKLVSNGQERRPSILVVGLLPAPDAEPLYSLCGSMLSTVTLGVWVNASVYWALASALHHLHVETDGGTLAAERSLHPSLLSLTYRFERAHRY